MKTQTLQNRQYIQLLGNFKIKRKHNNVDVINLSEIRKGRLEEIIIKKVSGNIEDITPDIVAKSFDELVAIETMDLRNEIINQVLDLSKDSFNYNRFKSDPFFTNSQIMEIYRDWIINEVKSKSCSLYYLMKNKEVAAFFLYKSNISPINSVKIGFVSLIASSNKFKKKKYLLRLYVKYNGWKATPTVLSHDMIWKLAPLSIENPTGYLSALYFLQDIR